MTYSVGEIASALGAMAVGDTALRIDAPRDPKAARKSDLALAMDPKYADALKDSPAVAAVLWQGADWQALGLKAAIFVERPRFAMSGLTAHFERARPLIPGVAGQVAVDETAQIAANAVLGPFVTVGARAQIGDGVQLFPGVSVAEDAVIGADVTIYEGAVIGARVHIGDRVMVHSNAVVGADGFSFVTPEAGAIDAFKSGTIEGVEARDQAYARIASLGSVHIGNDVEIGAGTCIDKGTVADTRIGNGTKIDNQVQIGHNVSVGQHCLLCGQVGIGGSAQIGDRVVLGGQAGVADHIKIGDDVIVAGAAGVSSNVPAGRVMMGNPAIQMASNIESYKHYRRLPRMAAKIEELQKLVSNLARKR